MQVRGIFTDLNNKRVVSALVWCTFTLCHQYFSFLWKLAQPFRFIAHNGEINTRRGNLKLVKKQANMDLNPPFYKRRNGNVIAGGF